MLANERMFDNGPAFRSVFLPDLFIDQAGRHDMCAVACLNGANIEAKALDVMGVAQLAPVGRDFSVWVWFSRRAISPWV
jgi:1-deoxy-D-xylulose-5-phosphate synthase